MYGEELSTEREKLQVSDSGVSIPTRISLSVIHTARDIVVFVHPEILIQTLIPWKHETPHNSTMPVSSTRLLV